MSDDTTAATSAWSWDEERVTIGRHFLRDLEGLWSEVLKLAAVVEEALDQSLSALCEGRVDLADEIRRQKPAVDRWEVAIERECVRVLALHQPVASDLRRVAAVLKINGDLERLAELARHIAKRVKKLAADPHAFPIPQPLEDLALAALAQVHHSLDALARADVHNAQAVIKADQTVDRCYRAVIRGLKQDIIDNPDRIDTWLRFVNTARNLERIADHGARIAEAVVYLKEGEILPNPGPALKPGGVSPRP
ncbi:MAG: phosphate signaling complex protein PhoU [Paludisphaera borealis]|uniref:phosphate signaling complex protein PhoU n=1 Tax=Paludisphaera borealis TaxID=1387353 RepID=UPI0028419569|nr:phosphate signaling complex protein PhoU [Paludisphaera borealis]MDR3623439.1 phosphate signaling complex protein PhoU [Paludisphaera borealis]